MVVMGAILRDSDLKEIGTFVADENSIDLEIADKDIRAEIKRNMRKEWLSISDSTLEGRGSETRISEKGKFEKPENVRTLDNFFTMLDEIGFTSSDVEVFQP